MLLVADRTEQLRHSDDRRSLSIVRPKAPMCRCHRPPSDGRECCRRPENCSTVWSVASWEPVRWVHVGSHGRGLPLQLPSLPLFCWDLVSLSFQTQSRCIGGGHFSLAVVSCSWETVVDAFSMDHFASNVCCLREGKKGSGRTLGGNSQP